MNFVALKMLVADRAKYFSLIFAIAFACFLLANQISIFIGIMVRPSSQIRDVVDADIWVMIHERPASLGLNSSLTARFLFLG